MYNREVSQLRTNGLEALCFFNTTGQCHEQPVDKKGSSCVEVFINIVRMRQGVNSRE